MARPWPHFLALLLALLELCLTAPANAQDISPFYTTAINDSRTSISVDIGGNSQVLYSESHALLIGEVNYANWDPLVTVPGDLAGLTKALERQHFKVEVHFDLISDRLMNVIDRFVKAHDLPDARLFIYVAAHGHSQDAMGRRLGYLLPIDAPNKDSPETSIIAKSLPMTMFAAWAQQPNARHMFAIFDSCFAGAFFGYRGAALNPGVAPRSPAIGAADFGFKLDQDGELVPPKPPYANGLEVTNFAILDPEERGPGRQFLAAGDSNQAVPGKSLIARLLTFVLDDQIPLTTDYWTTGDAIGAWMKKTVPSLSRSLLNDPAPPTPVYGRMPHDDVYSLGDIVFWRRNQQGIPIVADSADEAAWRVAVATPIQIGKITERTDSEIQSARAKAARQAQIAVEAEGRYAALSLTQIPSGIVLKPIEPWYSSDPLAPTLATLKLTALEARKEEAAAIARADSATRALQNGQSTTDQINLAVATTTPKPTARLTPTEEQRLRVLIDALSSDDTPTRRGARTDLTKWLAALPPEKQPTTINMLLNNLSRKSYRYQVGIAMAVADQPRPLLVSDQAQLAVEIDLAEKAPAGKNAVLRQLLDRANKGIAQARGVQQPRDNVGVKR